MTTTQLVGTREEWLTARLELLAAEKEHTRRSDELAQRRRELPWVRIDKEYRFDTDEGSATLAEAVRRMTSVPAARIGLADRGRLAEGRPADVVVFDPATVADRATYDDPFQYPAGIDAVVVNGGVALLHGARDTGGASSRAGRALRAGG